MSHKKATTDNGRELHLYSRIGMYNEKTLSFFNEDDTDYDFTDVGVEIGVKKNRGDDDFITLTEGNGITITGKDVHFAFTEAQSALFKERPYYWQFRRTIDNKEKVWLNGDHDWHNGKFDAFTSDSEITIAENGEVIRIVIQESGGGSAIQFQDEGVDLGNNQADKVDFVGAGVTATRVGDTVTVTIPGASGTVESVNSGSGITVDNTDPVNPIVNLGGTLTQDVTVTGDFNLFFENPSHANGFIVGGTDQFNTVIFSATDNINLTQGSNVLDFSASGFALTIQGDAGGVGHLVQGGTGGFIEYLNPVATGNVLLSGGVAATNSWGKVGLTTHVSGILPVANGGTGASSLSGLPFWSLTGDFTINPSVGTSIAALINAGDQIRFLPSVLDQTGSVAFGLPGQTLAQWEVSSQSIRIHTRTSGFESINLSETASNFYASNGTENSSVRITGTTLILGTTYTDFAGAQYGADHSAFYTVRSLTDQGYVLGAKTFTGTQTFLSSGLELNNPANTFKYIFVGAAIAANRTVTMPLLTGNDVLVTEAFTQSLTNKTLGTGTVFSVSPTINDGITFTFNPTATVSGINVGQVSGNPSGAVNGDIWYESSGNSLNTQKTGLARGIITSSSMTTNRVQFASSTTFNLTDSANLTFVTNRLLGTTLYLTVSAGTATAGTAPLKMTSGTNLTTAEAGSFEYNGTNLFFTRTGTTRQTVLTANVVTTEVVVSDTTITVNIDGTDYKLLARA